MNQVIYNSLSPTDKVKELYKLRATAKQNMSAVDENTRTRACVLCKSPMFFAEDTVSRIKGHVHSRTGAREVQISGCCEYCFDKAFDPNHDPSVYKGEYTKDEPGPFAEVFELVTMGPEDTLVPMVTSITVDETGQHPLVLLAGNEEAMAVDDLNMEHPAWRGILMALRKKPEA